MSSSPELKLAYPLDDEIRARVLPLAQPYPKRPKQAMAAPTAQRQDSADPDAPILEAANV